MKDQKLILEEVEVDTSIPRTVESSGLSFAISLIVHLSIFLVLSICLFETNSSGFITLEVDTVDDAGPMMESVIEIDFDEDEDEEALEMDEAELEETMEELDEIEQALTVELTELEPFSMEDFEDEFAPPNKEEGGGGGQASENGTGRKPGFFGIEATGGRVVYLIDMSPSMQEGYNSTRFERAVNEVIKSVGELESDQEFLVLLFCFRMYAMNINGRGKFCKPTAENKQALSTWLYSAGLGPGTDPREAIVAALSTNPSCCFLLSDGEFNGRKYRNPPFVRETTAVKLAEKYNKFECPIHTIGLEDRGNQKMMTEIAEQSGGRYEFVPALNE